MQTKWGCLRLCSSLSPNPALAVHVALWLTLAPRGTVTLVRSPDSDHSKLLTTGSVQACVQQMSLNKHRQMCRPGCTPARRPAAGWHLRSLR